MRQTNKIKNSLIILLAITLSGVQSFGQLYRPSSEFKVSYANPQVYTIEDISVSGIQYLDKSSIISLSGLSKGDQIKIPGDQISQAIKKLWSQGILGNVRVEVAKVEGSKVWINIALEERSRLSRFMFDGTKKSEAKDLEEEIRLIKGKVVTDALIKNAKLSIKNYYADKGFTNTTISVEKKKDTIISNSVIVKFLVDKNEKIKIGKIDFINNEYYREGQLRRKLKGVHQKVRGRFWTNARLDKKKYKEAKPKVISFYNSKGHRDALFLKDTTYQSYTYRVNGKKVKFNQKLITEEENKLRIAKIDSIKAYNKALKESPKIDVSNKRFETYFPGDVLDTTLTTNTYKVNGNELSEKTSLISESDYNIYLQKKDSLKYLSKLRNSNKLLIVKGSNVDSIQKAKPHKVVVNRAGLRKIEKDIKELDSYVKHHNKKYYIIKEGDKIDTSSIQETTYYINGKKVKEGKELISIDKKSLIKAKNATRKKGKIKVGNEKFFVVHPGDKVDSVINPKLINMDIVMYEGKKYYFRNITWKGNDKYTDKHLGNILGIRKGDLYDFDNLNQRLNFNPTGADISSLYLDDGYLFFSVNPVEVLVEGDSIDIEMRMFEGQQATVNKVIVKGNTKTSDHVILRELLTMPGYKFNRSLLIKTQRRLSQLGYFDPEKMGVNPIPNPATGTVDIEYTVEEKPSDQIQLSGGYGGFFGFVGTLSLAFNNFSLRNIANFREYNPLPSGDGQRFSLSVQANGRSFQTYSTSFTEPWIGGKRPNALSVGLSHSIQRSGAFGGAFGRRNTGFGRQPLNRSLNLGNGSLRVTRMNVSLGKRLRWPDDDFTLTHGIAYTNYNMTDFSSGEFFLGTANGKFNNLSYTGTLARNSTDNPTYPRSGSNISLSANFTPPYSIFKSDDQIRGQTFQEKFRWMEFHKWMFDSWHFFKIVGNLVLNTRVHMGFMGAYNQNIGIGPFERFILGGSGLTGFNFLLGSDIIGLRGYDDNSIIPDKYNDDGTIDADSREGGIAFNKFVWELRYPISLNPAASIFVLSFFEAGNTWGNYREFNSFKMYRSTGVGARIFMPAFGLLGVDYGISLDKIPGNPAGSENRFTFTIGQQIR